MATVILLIFSLQQGFRDDDGNTSFIDDDSNTSFTDENGVTG